MPSYRIYLMDTVGSTALHDHYNCADDAAATTFAATLLGAKMISVEIWQGSRCVGSLSAPSLPGMNGFTFVA